MTYRQSVDFFRTLYTGGKKLTDEQILMYISIIQSDLQNKYGLWIKSSRNNTTAQTTCTVGTATISEGTSATTIPNDIKSIFSICLNDTPVTSLKPTGQSEFKNTVKVQTKPQYYALYSVGATTGSALTLEFDSKPDVAYELTIMYLPKCEIFTGSGTDTTWTDWDKSESDWGGSLKLPSDWHTLIVQGAVAMLMPELKQEWYAEVRDKRRYEPLENFSGEIPAIGAFSERPVYEEPGRDPKRW